MLGNSTRPYKEGKYESGFPRSYDGKRKEKIGKNHNMLLLLGECGKVDMWVGLVSELSLPLCANHVADPFRHDGVYDGMAAALGVAQAVDPRQRRSCPRGQTQRPAVLVHGGWCPPATRGHTRRYVRVGQGASSHLR